MDTQPPPSPPGASADAAPLPSLAVDRAFARAAGAEPIDGNAARLLLDAGENYPTWLAAIRAARSSILFESYIVDDDAVGREFVAALAERARAGVAVFVVYDWLGSRGGAALWDALAAAGAQVRGFNPPRLSRPLEWLSRDHRKTIVVDTLVGFVSGLCVSAKWCGNPARSQEPWRDTGIELRGPAVRELVTAFDDVWHACGGTALPATIHAAADDAARAAAAGNVRVRVVAGEPDETGTYRLDLVIAGLARRYLWLTDAYFVGTAAYVQALAAAARDGVDVRLLVPGASDIPVVSALSRTGYRPLLEAGVRVYEWNGTMLHAKTAVADDSWARVGSTNLNLASWTGNYELDVAIEDAVFARQMATQYEADLARATEIVLTRRNRVRPADPNAPHDARRALSGSAGRAAAGAVSVGSALGAALTNRRVLGTAEAGLLGRVGAVALGLAAVGALWPAVIAWPLSVLAGWLGLAWLIRAAALRHERLARGEDARADAADRGEAAPAPAGPGEKRANVT